MPTFLAPETIRGRTKIQNLLLILRTSGAFNLHGGRPSDRPTYLMGDELVFSFYSHGKFQFPHHRVGVAQIFLRVKSTRKARTSTHTHTVNEDFTRKSLRRSFVWLDVILICSKYQDKKSIKQHKESVNFRCNIQLCHSHL